MRNDDQHYMDEKKEKLFGVGWVALLFPCYIVGQKNGLQSGLRKPD